MPTRPTPFILLAAAIIAALLPACSKGGKGHGNSAAGEKAGPGKQNTAQLPVNIYTLRPQPFSEIVSATGALEADEQITLRTEIAGVVEEIFFQEGQAMKKGQPLIRLRDDDQKATLARALAQKEYASNNAKRLQQLFEKKAISQADYDEAASQAKVAEAEAEVARVALEKTHVDAPFDGVVGLRSISFGAYLEAAAAIAEFRKLDSLKLDFSVPERYLPFLKEGLNVTFTVAGRGESFPAVVYAIEPGVDIRTRTVRLKARAAQPANPLLPGTYAQVKLELSRDPEALLIPSLAVLPSLKEETVYVLTDGKAQPRAITSRIRTGNAVLVADGLKAGDQVIISNLLQLRPGLAVKVREDVDFRAQTTFAPEPTENAKAEGEG